MKKTLTFMALLVIGLHATIVKAEKYYVVCAPSALEPASQGSSQPDKGLWPAIYIEDREAVCFDVTSWPEYKGDNCYTNDGDAQWSAYTETLNADGSSEGRDYTNYRVQKGTITSRQINYHLEWGRDDQWHTYQEVTLSQKGGEGSHWKLRLGDGKEMVCTASAENFG